MVKQHEECWCSTRCTLISVKIRSDQTGLLLECWGSVYRWFTSISAVNGIGDAGTGSLASTVPSACSTWTRLNGNQIGKAGAESLAGVLGQCPALAHLNLEYNAGNLESMTGQEVKERYQ